MIFFDTETIGFHGLAVLIQWARDDGRVHLHDVFQTPVGQTLKLIDQIATDPDGVVGFNLAFDWFHLSKIRTVFDLLDKRQTPLEQLEALRHYEPKGRDGWCLKPTAACDLLVQASEGKHQTLMLEHNELRVRSLPTYMSKWVAELLNRKLQFPDIYFARRKDPSIRFQALPKKRAGFDDVVLKFAPKQDLKSLVAHILHVPMAKLADIDTPEYPEQKGYAPYGGWTEQDILAHVKFWECNKDARSYAEDDVTYTRQLYHAFDSPKLGDLNSTLTCMVGSVRWRGFSVDQAQVETYGSKCAEIMGRAPRDPTKARKYISDVMDEEEKQFIKVSTKKQVLEDLVDVYHGTEVGKRAYAVLRARQAKYNHDMCRKLLTAGRFHAAASVIGTLSGRKSGRGGDFNSQGISKHKSVRKLFTFARPGEVLCGGDFQSFEVCIADGFFNDPVLRQDLLNGTSIHGMFGTFMYPGKTYEEILASSGTMNDMYKKSKSGVFLTLYGGSPSTYKRNLNIPMDVATSAYERFTERYQVVGEKREAIFKDYEMLSQPDGIGTVIKCRDPAKTSVESMLGFSRSFEPEFDVIRALNHLSENLPPEVRDFDKNPPFTRNKRKQRPSSALKSALYAAAFGIQGSVQRAANNHVIQSSGAGICKELEVAIWELQPAGFHPWVVAPVNFHDELMVATAPEAVGRLRGTVQETIERFKDRIPLLGIDWENNKEHW